MTTLLKSLFAPSVTVGRSPSFNDFSLRVGEDAESDLAEMYESSAYSMQGGQDGNSPQPARADVWQSTFSPQMNVNMKKVGRSFYDAVDDKEHAATVWENIVKADTIKRVSFKHFDKNNDGLIDAQELRAELGANANVDALIAKVDRDGDGRINFEEFCDLLRKS